jgi:hypothetical protein
VPPQRIAQGQVVGNGKWTPQCVTRKPWNGPANGAPTAYARGHAGASQVVWLRGSLPRARRRHRGRDARACPSELGGLQAFAHEAVHRPGVVGNSFRPLGALDLLRVMLRDVDDSDASRSRQQRPAFAPVSGAALPDMSSRACLTSSETMPGFAPIRDQRGAIGFCGPMQCKSAFTLLVIGSRGGGPAGVGGLRPAMIRWRHRGRGPAGRGQKPHHVGHCHVDRQVEQEVAGPHSLAQHLVDLPTLHARAVESDALLSGPFETLVGRLDDLDPVRPQCPGGGRRAVGRPRRCFRSRAGRDAPGIASFGSQEFDCILVCDDNAPRLVRGRSSLSPAVTTSGASPDVPAYVARHRSATRVPLSSVVFDNTG